MSKYTLMVSHNLGVTYTPDMYADVLASFDCRCADLDTRLLRWNIEDEEGNQVIDRPCAIHREIVEMMRD